MTDKTSQHIAQLTNKRIDWTAQMPENFLGVPWGFIWVFFGLSVGLLVSLDVWGLIHSQWRSFQINETTGKSVKTPWKQARMHALVHASLFLIYMGLVSYGLAALSEIIEPLTNWFIANIPNMGFVAWINQLNINFNQARHSLIVISGVVIIMFVWLTYKDKLFENHADKLRNSSDLGETLRFDVKIAYRAIDFLWPNCKYLLDAAMALAVAVDMLAVSAIIRVLFKDEGDSGYDGMHLDISGHNLIDIILFSLLIAIVVFCVTLRTAKKIQTKGNSPSQIWLFGIRIAEPVFIFSILFATLPHLIGSNDLVADELNNFTVLLLFYLKALLFGILMTGTLVLAPGRGCKRGLNQIRIATRRGSKVNFSTDPVTSKFAGWGFCQRLKYLVRILLRAFGASFLFAGVVLLLLLMLSIAHNSNTANPIKSFSEMLYGSVIIITVFFLYAYFPFTGRRKYVNLGKLEVIFDNKFFAKRYHFSIGAAPFLAFFLVIISIHYLYRGNLLVLIDDTRPDITGIFLSVLFPFFVFCLFKWRTHRQELAMRLMIRSGGEVGNYHYQENIGELLKAAGLAALLWKFWLEAYFV